MRAAGRRTAGNTDQQHAFCARGRRATAAACCAGAPLRYHASVIIEEL